MVECDVHTLAVLINRVTIQLCHSPSDSTAPSTLSCVSLGPLTVHIYAIITAVGVVGQVSGEGYGYRSHAICEHYRMLAT